MVCFHRENTLSKTLAKPFNKTQLSIVIDKVSCSLFHSTIMVEGYLEIAQ